MTFANTTAGLALVAFLCAAGGSLGQDVTTATAATETVTTAAVASATVDWADDSDTTHSIVLLGEKVGLDSNSPKKGPFADLVDATTSTLGTDVADFTLIGATLPATAQAIAGVPGSSADVAVVFGGFSDEREAVSDEDLAKAIADIAAELKRRDPNMKIFLVPSATFVGTLTSARMRLAAQEVGITFVELGTEVSGEPYRQAMRTVQNELTGVVEEEPAQTPRPAVTPAPTATPRPKPEQTSSGDSTATESADQVRPGTARYQERQASLEQELSRIAGDTEDSSILPPSLDSLSTGPAMADELTTNGPAIPPGGTVTKRGAEAKDNINMRPLPALKAYKPQIPVPRNEIDKKEPALSR